MLIRLEDDLPDETGLQGSMGPRCHREAGAGSLRKEAYSCINFMLQASSVSIKNIVRIGSQLKNFPRKRSIALF